MRLRDETSDGADRDPVAVAHAPLDAGIRMVDTADAYQNEELVGRAIRGRREQVLLASKFGLVWRDGAAGGFDVRADRPYVLQACEASLRRLGIETIDLYYLHHRSERAPIEETVGAMAELVAQGKVRGTHQATDGQVALAWVHHRQQVHGLPVVPLPGTTRVSHLRSNLAAADLRLTDHEVRRLDSLVRAS